MPYPTVRVYVDLVADGVAAASTWTEITAYVCHDSMSIAWGRSRGADDIQPGSGQFSLINTDGRFDPTYSSGAYFPNFRLRRRIKIEATYNAVTYPLAYGWIESINQRWNHRAEQIAEVRWVDGLGALATHELPESVWDYVIANRANKVAWFKLGADTTSRTVDYSGSKLHGRYVTYEGVSGPYGASATPKQVIQAGASDSVIRQVNRQSLSWAKMIAEADQPLGGVNVDENWRTTAIVCDQSTSALITPTQDCTIETWLTLRPAYPLNSTNLKSGSAIETCLFQWGDSANWTGASPGPTGPMIRVGVTTDGRFRMSRYSSAGGLTSTALAATNSVPTGEPCHIAMRKVGTTLTFYVNGVLQTGSISIASAPVPWGFPLALGYSTGFWSANTNHMSGNWSTWGDVVIYDRALSGTEIADSYSAGRWGRLGVSGTTQAGTAVVQALTMVGWGLTTAGIQTGGHVVEPGATDRRTALDYIRGVALSEGALCWFSPTAQLRFWTNDWSVTQSVATTTQYLLTDDNTTTGSSNEVGHAGGNVITYDDTLLVNDCSVSWVGGEVRSEAASSIAAYGRYRKSVSTYLADSDDAQGRADWETWRRGTPRAEIAAITVEANDDTSWLAVLGLGLGHRVRVIVTRPNGTKIDSQFWIESVSMSIDMGQGVFSTTFGLTPADTPAAPFIVGTSTLNSTAVLWF